MTATDELIPWLREQLNEDERVAMEARCGGEGRWHQTDPDREAGRIEDERGEVVTYDEGSPSEHQAEHIALHDPARVLREVEAKRQIMAIHHPQPYGSIYPAICDGCGYAGSCEDPLTEDINDCPELRILAAVYSARPGYREEWRP